MLHRHQFQPLLVAQWWQDPLEEEEEGVGEGEGEEAVELHERKVPCNTII